MFSPPRELGREAFNRAHSGRGPSARSDKASNMALSKTTEACWVWLGGLVRRAKATLGRARQDRRRVASICESWRSPSLARISCTFITLLSTVDSQWEAGPMGEPRRSNPPLVVGMSAGRGL